MLVRGVRECTKIVVIHYAKMYGKDCVHIGWRVVHNVV